MDFIDNLSTEYWENFTVNNEDLEFLYNHLLEIEIPQTTSKLLYAIINNRINNIKSDLLKHRSSQGEIYKPESTYNINDKIVFPKFDWKIGKVIGKRPGINPDIDDFDVIEVEFDDYTKKYFASRHSNHLLNDAQDINNNDPNLKIEKVLNNFNNILLSQVSISLEKNQDLVQIAGKWFPKSLLIDINVGYLNLAEAVLDMETGGPLTTQYILEQIDLPTDTNAKLSEFSMNFALQEDERFDEVGPAGKTLWFLKRLEPNKVLDTPLHLKNICNYQYDYENIAQYIEILDNQIYDELDLMKYDDEIDQISLSLIYPHWRNGTLPLSNRINTFFPTAYEAPRVQFTLIDSEDNSKYSGWVVRSSKYVYGLEEWYKDKELIPGSLINIQRGQSPGEVLIKVIKRRSTREWIRTALVGTDGEIVFATLKQMVSADFNERMVIAVPDIDAIDNLWNSYKNVNLENIIQKFLRELVKLNPQGHVHALEIYSAVNLVKRCPPGPILDILFSSPWSKHFGDLYFHLNS